MTRFYPTITDPEERAKHEVTAIFVMWGVCSAIVGLVVAVIGAILCLV